jgi:glycosyltransferase involved in cell wall biosynthesis
MKIAFVNQPFDVIVPPFQNSIGYDTYGLSRPLAKSCTVIVYGSKDVHPANALEVCDPCLDLRLFTTSPMDRFIFESRKRLGRIVQISSPISTSDLLFPQYGRDIAQDLQREQCDVVYIQHCSQYAPVIRALNPKSKIILHIHAEWFSQSNFAVLQHRLTHVDLLLTVSDYITRKTQRDFPEISDRCETLYCAIDPKEFRWEKDYSAGRQRKEKRILYTGAVSPQKGPHILLDAFNIVARQYPNVRLDLIGTLRNYPMEETFDLNDKELIQQVAALYPKHPLKRLKARFGLEAPDAGTYQSALKSKIYPDLTDKISFSGFIGRRKEIVDRYYDADVFVFPPIWEEGFGLPPIEAMAAGVPVVGSRSGALLETVKDGETGFLVEKNDPEALARKILILLEDEVLREKMGRAARQRALAYFTWERMAGILEERSRQLCGNGSIQVGRRSGPGVAV